ncbi:tRNA (uracil-5-)-methyltransferase [Achlya hypogyna]|uniref:tRNA (Uracil-5-)-methyltransferase n=1 Tax=Achlya hypogyna TaxID=1202772 RepID=A0A1V9ZA90_ACHHY|nr:tRNA (uracil-5-)-methyltransferase [Achlya hypogyna]
MAGQRKHYGGKKRKASDGPRDDVHPGHLTKNDECKIIVLNFGQWSEKDELVKVLDANNHAYKAVQKLNKLSYGFIIYESKEQRDAALEVLANVEWKNGEKLEVKPALPKRSVKPMATADEPKEPGQLKTVIEAVTPWHNVDYAEQLERKEDAMKKVLIKIVRQTRKDFADKAKRVVEERNRLRKAQKVASMDDVVGGPKLEVPVPEWLDATGELYLVANDTLYQQIMTSTDAPWEAKAKAEGIVGLISFTSELVGAHKEGALLTYQKHTQSWMPLSNGPAAAITSLASLRGHLLCATANGEIVRRVVKGRRDSIEWMTLASGLGAITAMTVHQGFLYIATTSGWSKAPLGPEATTVLVFEPAPEMAFQDVSGLTSHDSKLIFIQKTGDHLSLVHAETDGTVVSSTKIDVATAVTSFASHKGLCCPMERIAPSPVLEGYRNKCEFTFGYDVDKKPVVGFRVGMYKEGVVAVGSPEDCINVPQVMKDICKTFQTYLATSTLPVYDVLTHEGVWRLLTIRLSQRTNQIMLMVQANPTDVDAAVWATEKTALVSTLTAAHPGISSMFVQEYTGVSAPAEDHPIDHVYGATTIEEELLGLKFRISAQAFFQVNTPGAEVLYSLVKRFAAADDKTQVYDVCCGTGTIGICVASEARKVIGVELCKAATDDAAVNADLNAVKNITFINSKAEDVMKELLRKKPEGEGAEFVQQAVAIVDPPRAGLHTKVLRSLRDTRPVKRIVYVSCNPTVSLINDAATLCGPSTSNLRGDPFKPVFAAPVDMFPHTEHCEMIIVFERV